MGVSEMSKHTGTQDMYTSYSLNELVLELNLGYMCLSAQVMILVLVQI